MRRKSARWGVRVALVLALVTLLTVNPAMACRLFARWHAPVWRGGWGYRCVPVCPPPGYVSDVVIDGGVCGVPVEGCGTAGPYEVQRLPGDQSALPPPPVESDDRAADEPPRLPEDTPPPAEPPPPVEPPPVEPSPLDEVQPPADVQDEPFPDLSDLFDDQPVEPGDAAAPPAEEPAEEPADDLEALFGEEPSAAEPPVAPPAEPPADEPPDADTDDDLFGDLFGPDAAEPAADQEDDQFGAPGDPGDPGDTNDVDLFGPPAGGTPPPVDEDEPAGTTPPVDEGAPADDADQDLDFFEPGGADLDDENLDDLFSRRTGQRAAEPASPVTRPATEARSVPPEPSLSMRRWVDDTGQYQTLGQLVEVGRSYVRLLKENGHYATVPVTRLSDRDFEYVRRVVEQYRQQGQPSNVAIR